MHDVLLQLRQISTSDQSAMVAAPAPRPQTMRSGNWLRVGLLAAPLLATAAAGFWWGRVSDNRGDLNQLMFNVLPPNGVELGPGISVSPDGQSLAAIALGAPGSPSRLWIRHLRSSAATLLPGTEGAAYPFWSPDGRSIAFFAQGKLKRTDLEGGAPIVISDVDQGRGGTWMDDDTIVLASLESAGLLRVPAGGGVPTVLVKVEDGSGIANLRFPERVGPRRFIYLALAEDEADSEVRLTSLDEPDSSVTVVRALRSAAYVNGFLLYDRNGVIVSQAFDTETGLLSGEPEPLVELPRPGIRAGNIGYSPIASGNRTIAWYARPQRTGQLTWLGRDGATVGTLGAPDTYGAFALSPDDHRLAITNEPRLLVMDATTGTHQGVANEANIASPTWSPDGTRVAFTASGGPNASINLYSVAVSPPFRVEPLVEAPLMLLLGGWTPRGDFLWLQPRSQTVKASLPGPAWINDRGALMRAPGAEPTLITAEADAWPLAVSPDGLFLAYPRQVAGRWDVCLDRIEPPRGCRAVEASSATRPLALTWRADGREFVFRAGDDVMSVPLQPGALPANPRAVRLFQARGSFGLAVTRTGDRLLVLEPRSEPPTTISVAGRLVARRISVGSGLRSL
jgi:Tol biopolymer transport system component